MAYKIEMNGLDEIISKLDKAGKEAEKVASHALYKGAGAVANSVSREAKKIKTNKRFRYMSDGHQRLASPEEKEAVVSAVGIAKFKTTGNEVNTSVGYSKSGYVSINGKQKPVALIAASINHGTSFMKRQPFIRKGKSQSKAEQVMEEEIQKETEKLLEDI